MAVTAKLYGPFIQSLLNKEVDFDTDTVRVMLTTSAYVPDQDTHRYKSDVTNEVTGTGYTAAGAALANKTVTYTTGTNVAAIDADDVTWTASTITARCAVIYDAAPATDATRPLIGYVLSDVDITSSNGPFTIQWDTGGIATITVT